METLRLENVSKIFKGKNKKEGDVVAVKDFNLVVEDNEFIVFVGPSGCGKSTTLRMIAGLEDITSGSLYIDGEYVNNIEANYRNIAMVFQNYALYPHMSAYKNMAFGLKNRHVPKEEIDKRINEAAKILDIEDLLNRKPRAMSGGQRQRVALGRAIVRTPKIFLLDEPLSNLDAKLRAQMRVEINKLYEKLKTTFIYVTHDQVEAMTMGTRIVVMRKGIVQQIDTPTTLYDYPKNRFVAGFLGTPQMNFYEVEFIYKEDKVEIKLFDTILSYPLFDFREIHKDYLDGNEHKVILGIRPDNILVSKDGKLKAKINIIENLGNGSLIYADFNFDNQNLINESSSQIVISLTERTTYKIGDVINFDFVSSKLHFFKDEEGNEVSIINTPRSDFDFIKGYLKVDDENLTIYLNPKNYFAVKKQGDIKINPVYENKLHRIKMNLSKALKIDANGELSLVYLGKGTINGKTYYRYSLNKENNYDELFMNNDYDLYLNIDPKVSVLEEVKFSLDLSKVEILGDDNLSIFDLNEKENNFDEYDFVEIKEEQNEKKGILKIFKGKKSEEVSKTSFLDKIKEKTRRLFKNKSSNEEDKKDE